MKYLLIEIEFLNLYQKTLVSLKNKDSFNLELSLQYQTNDLINFSFYLEIFQSKLQLLRGRCYIFNTIDDYNKNIYKILKKVYNPNLSYTFIQLVKPKERFIPESLIFYNKEKKIWYNDINFIKIINNFYLTKQMRFLFIRNLLEVIVKYRYLSLLKNNSSIREDLFFHILFTYITQNNFQFIQNESLGFYYFKIGNFLFLPFLFIKNIINKINFTSLIIFINHFINRLLYNFIMIFNYDYGMRIFYLFFRKYYLFFEKNINFLLHSDLDFDPNLKIQSHKAYDYIKKIIYKQQENNKKRQERNLNYIAILIALLAILITFFFKNGS